MEQEICREYLNILREELVPATGCTEPIAVAYCAALAKRALGSTPEQVTIYASANIIKNVKSVVVPHTGGLRGIAAAAAAGIIAGDPDRELEVLSGIPAEKISAIAAYLEQTTISLERSQRDFVFDLQVQVRGAGHTAFAEIAGHHTNVIELRRDTTVLIHQPYVEESASVADCSLLSVENIIAFANEINLEEITPLLQRQIDCNLAIAREGLSRDYGASIGKILLSAYGDTTYNRAKAYAAAGVDARMGGCDLPVVINSGSGNQGLTTSLPSFLRSPPSGSFWPACPPPPFWRPRRLA